MHLAFTVTRNINAFTPTKLILPIKYCHTADSDKDPVWAKTEVRAADLKFCSKQNTTIFHFPLNIYCLYTLLCGFCKMVLALMELVRKHYAEESTRFDL